MVDITGREEGERVGVEEHQEHGSEEKESDSDEEVGDEEENGGQGERQSEYNLIFLLVGHAIFTVSHEHSSG